MVLRLLGLAGAWLKPSASVKDPPPDMPQLSKVSQMLTANWTRGDNTYVLGNSSRHGVSQTDCREPSASSSLPLMNEYT